MSENNLVPLTYPGKHPTKSKKEPVSLFAVKGGAKRSGAGAVPAWATLCLQTGKPGGVRSRSAMAVGRQRLPIGNCCADRAAGSVLAPRQQKVACSSCECTSNFVLLCSLSLYLITPTTSPRSASEEFSVHSHERLSQGSPLRCTDAY